MTKENSSEGGDDSAIFTADQVGTYEYDDFVFTYSLTVNADGTVDFTLDGAKETGLTVSHSEALDGWLVFKYSGREVYLQVVDNYNIKFNDNNDYSGTLSRAA